MMTDYGPDPFTNMFEAPAKLARALFAPMAEATAGTPVSAEDMRHWADVGMKLQIKQGVGVGTGVDDMYV